MKTVETMSTIISTATPCTEQAEELAALAACWPQFSAPELCRLRFLAYRHDTGRLRPAAPLSAAGTQLAAEVATYLRARAALPAPQPPTRQEQGATVGVPPLWRAWLEARAASASPAPSAGCR